MSRDDLEKPLTGALRVKIPLSQLARKSFPESHLTSQNQSSVRFAASDGRTSNATARALLIGVALATSMRKVKRRGTRINRTTTAAALALRRVRHLARCANRAPYTPEGDRVFGEKGTPDFAEQTGICCLPDPSLFIERGYIS